MSCLMSGWCAKKSNLIRHVTSDEKSKKCKNACDDCSICMTINNDYQLCYRECDRCRYCSFKKHNYDQEPDPPYWNRYPELPNPILYGDVLYSELGSKDELPIGKLNYAQSKFTTSNVCGPVMYQEYIDQYNNYMECKNCKRSGMCWSQNSKTCVHCDQNQLNRSCESRFGCLGNTPNNVNGHVPPKDPLYTACIPCWKK